MVALPCMYACAMRSIHSSYTSQRAVSPLPPSMTPLTMLDDLALYNVALVLREVYHGLAVGQALKHLPAPPVVQLAQVALHLPQRLCT